MLRLLLGTGLAIALAAGVSVAERGPSPQSVAQSDLARGAEAASGCESMTWSTEDYSDCIDSRVARAMDSDGASASFQLGVYCSAFFKLALAHKARLWKQSPIDLDHAEVATVNQYDSCAYFAQSLGIGADRLCTTLGLSCDVFNQMLRRWQSISQKGM
jgi:hypothetical protein